MKLKRLKNQDAASIRRAITHVMSWKLQQWWTPLLMQAAMWGIGAKLPLEEVHGIMDDIYEESLDLPLNQFERGHTFLCYRCVAYFHPSK